MQRNFFTYLVFIGLFSGCGKVPGDGHYGEWEPLFNGKDLSGWEVVGNGNWFTQDGELVVKKMEGRHGGGWLVTRKDYLDFHLQMKIKVISPETNSGILIRDPGHAKIFRPAFNGFEVQVNDAIGDKDWTNTNGAIYSLARAYYKKMKTESWNEFEVHCQEIIL